MNGPWNSSVDVLVVGSGAGALTAALKAATQGASVLVVEKSPLWGGTSATSGGGIWIPNSHLAKAAGAEDSPAEAFDYVRALSDPSVPDSLIQSYIRQAPLMLEWVEHNSPVRYLSIPYTDYHAELPGGKLGFRTHLPMPLDGRKLGQDVMTIRPVSPAASLFGRINWSLEEAQPLLLRPPGWPKILLRMLWRYYSDVGQRLRSRTDRFLTQGNALVGGLKMALNGRSAPVWLSAPLIELVRSGDRVVGAVVEHQGKPVRIEVRKGVILGAGGFERDASLRSQHLGQADPLKSGSQENNTGDALTAAIKIGAATRNLDHAWWAPVFSVPGEDRARPSFVERALPGCIIVDSTGRRYLNEAASYHVVGQAMATHGGGPSFVIFDEPFRRKYPMGALIPLAPLWLQPRGLRQILKRAPTVEQLAEKIGISPAALKATIDRFNVGARKGEDPEFHRGEPAYDRFFGDPRVQPNPNLAPLETGPYYAMPIFGGDIGTSGGLVTDENAQVLDEAGHPIGGLYAIGNTAASVMGGSYPGAGSTIGPAMTFGFAAAKHALGANSEI